MTIRVVIAEDEAIIRMDLRETLEEEGYEVVGETGRGDTAVELVRDLLPDLAILDIKMPGMDGLEAARIINAEKLCGVLVLTAFSQREVVEEARDAGALAYLVKPFQKSDLVPAIEVAIGRFRELRAMTGEIDALGEQLEARKAIERAKGVLMDEMKMSEQDAFTYIQRTAMSERSKMRQNRRTHHRRLARGRCRSMTKLLLVDGNSLTYRAFFALPQDMSTASGQLTNAVFGFTSMFINVLKEQRPDEVLVAFDRPEPTFRHEADETYKANRDAAPDPLRQQMGLVREVLSVLGVATRELAGWEADDIIATVVDQAVGRGDEVLIVTGDRDAYQLVQDPHIKVLYNRRGVSDYALYDEAGILERTGVTPAQYPEYAAMRGDPSDNLPGVPGVGEKTAAKLIQTYGGLDGIFANVDKQTPKLRASLAEHEERVRKNHEIMILRRDAADRAARVAGDASRTWSRSRSSSTSSSSARSPSASPRPSGRPPSCCRAMSANSWWPRWRRRSRRRSRRQRCRRWRAVDLAAAWAGEPGRSPLVGLAVVTDPDTAAVTWIPADHLDDPAVADALGAAGGAGPRRQGADARAAGPRATDRPRRAGARHRHRRLPARSGRGPLRARPPGRALHPLRPGPRRTGGQGSARPRRHRRRAVDGRRARGARRAPARRADHVPDWPPTAWPSCTPRSRTPWSGCSPGWSTPASASTSPTSASCTPA